jgi:hypothetical protein
MPLAAMSKKQTCVSHSTPEAELVAADLALRAEGLPALDIWETILGRPVKLSFQEDNQAAIVVLKSGYSSALRHMGRTHKVCLRWLSERVAENEVELEYCLSAKQAADIFTKGFTDAAKWLEATNNIGVAKPRIETDRVHQPAADIQGKEGILPPQQVDRKILGELQVHHNVPGGPSVTQDAGYNSGSRVKPPTTNSGGQVKPLTNKNDENKVPGNSGRQTAKPAIHTRTVGIAGCGEGAAAPLRPEPCMPNARCVPKTGRGQAARARAPRSGGCVLGTTPRPYKNINRGIAENRNRFTNTCQS